MATFEAQVEALTSLAIDGSSAPTQTELSQFLTDGAKEILNALPRSKKIIFGSSSSLNSSSPNLTLNGCEIFGVTRDDGTINQPCRQIPFQLSGRASDSGDMIAATSTDPVYYIQNNILSVIPEPTNSNNASVQIMSYPTVAFGDSAVSRFPDEYEYLIPLYAAIKSLTNKLTTFINSDLSISVSAPSAPSLATISYSNASNADASSTAVSAITVSSISKADISGDVPTYSKPTISLTSNLSVSDLSISSSAPSAPSLGTVSYSDATNADASASSIGAITVASVSVADTSGNVPTYTKPTTSVNFGSGNNFDTMLGTNEDIELASVELQKQSQLLNSYKVDIDNELNEFNKENVRYQASIQAQLAKHNSDLRKAITQAEIDSRDAQQEASLTTDVSKFNKSQDQILALQNSIKNMEATIANNDDLVAKFIQEINLYQQNVNKEVTEYRSNYEKDFAIFSKKRDTELQNYSLDIQNELNEFNKENVRYQANVQAELAKHNTDLQVELRQAQIDAQDAQQEASRATDVDKFNKAQDQALDLQNKAQSLQASIQNNEDLIQKFLAELNKYSSQVNTEVQTYSQNLTNDNQNYQFYLQQQAKLQSDYDKGIQILRGV